MEAAEVAAEQAELALQSSQDEYAASLRARRAVHNCKQRYGKRPFTGASV